MKRAKRKTKQLADVYRERIPSKKVRDAIEMNSGIGAGMKLVNSMMNKEKASGRMQTHLDALADLELAIMTNRNSGTQWARTDFLPSSKEPRPLLKAIKDILKDQHRRDAERPGQFFRINRKKMDPMEWEAAYDGHSSRPAVDFTTHPYTYPEKLDAPPANLGDYPRLKPLKALMEIWPQDDIDHPPTPFEEVLIHFDFTNPEDMEAARKFRDAKLPFKLTNVPEVEAAGEKWTDEYLNEQFSPSSHLGRDIPKANGNAQESSNNFFAFFNKDGWDTPSMGLAPTRNNDWTFEQWAKHAKYADAEGLDPNQPHFYFQAGVDREERYMDYSEWTFISRDLPSLSSPEETFFVFEPESQKGIQCRFGERGVTAATHFDGGRNMVAMITGAKRYILSPPRECPKLGIVTKRGNAEFRHSMLNFGHLNMMDHPDMPKEEKEWLDVSGESQAVETVLKAGEVLYIPSHWFHYITSLQKSAQCNVRSGIDKEGDEVFGGLAEVSALCDPAV